MKIKRIIQYSLAVLSLLIVLFSNNNIVFADDFGDCQATQHDSGGSDGDSGQSKTDVTADIGGGWETDIPSTSDTPTKNDASGNVKITHTSTSTTDTCENCHDIEVLNGTSRVDDETYEKYTSTSLTTTIAAIDGISDSEGTNFSPDGTSEHACQPWTGKIVKVEYTLYSDCKDSPTTGYDIQTKDGKYCKGSGSKQELELSLDDLSLDEIYGRVKDSDSNFLNSVNIGTYANSNTAQSDAKTNSDVTNAANNKRSDILNKQMITADRIAIAIQDSSEQMGNSSPMTDGRHITTSIGSDGSTITYAYAYNPAFATEDECYRVMNFSIVAKTECELNNKYNELSSSNLQFSDGCWQYSKNTQFPDGAAAYNGQYSNYLESSTPNLLNDIYVVKGVSNPSVGYLWSLSSALDTAKSTNRRVTSADLEAVTIKFKTHSVYAEATGNYKDYQIYMNNPSGDMYIKNTTNEKARFYGEAHYLPLTGTSLTEFNAILANTTPSNPDNFQYVWTRSNGKGGQSIGLAAQGDYVIKLSSKEDMDMGTNIVTGYAFIDIYKQRLFEIEETKGLYFTITGNITKAAEKWNSLTGKEVFLFVGRGTGACARKYRYINTYFGNVSGSGVVYNEDPFYNVFSYDCHEMTEDNSVVTTSVRKMIEKKFGSINAAFRDLVGNVRTTVSGYNRAMFILGTENVTVNFNAGQQSFNYNTYPDGLLAKAVGGQSPSISVGGLSGNAGKTTETGIYTEVQKKIKEGWVTTITLYPEYNSWETPGDHWEYTVCVGEYHCTCADINVICDCADEEMGCPNDTTKPEGWKNVHSYNCDDMSPGSMTAEQKKQCDCYEEGKYCDGDDYTEDIKTPEDTSSSANKKYPGGKTGGGSSDYMDKYYDSNSSMTN